MYHSDSSPDYSKENEKSTVSEITLGEDSTKRAEHIENERKTAIAELIHDAYLYPHNDQKGKFAPYKLIITTENRKLNIEIKGNNESDLLNIELSIRPLKQIIKDYFLIVESYEKVKLDGNTMKLQPIDVARRGIHNEGAEILKDSLEEKIIISHKTARRIFTLICILHLGKTRSYYY